MKHAPKIVYGHLPQQPTYQGPIGRISVIRASLEDCYDHARQRAVEITGIEDPDVRCTRWFDLRELSDRGEIEAEFEVRHIPAGVVR